MKSLIIGAEGQIGKIITPALAQNYEVIKAGRNSGDLQVDMNCAASIENLFARTGALDVVVSAAGNSVSSELHSMKAEQYLLGLQQKLMGQINLVLLGLKHIRDNGSITLISGKMGERPAKGSTGKAVVNGAIQSFVLAAALEMPRGIRINVVSPAKLTGFAARDLVEGYMKSIATSANGEIIRIGYK